MALMDGETDESKFLYKKDISGPSGDSWFRYHALRMSFLLHKLRIKPLNLRFSNLNFPTCLVAQQGSDRMKKDESY